MLLDPISRINLITQLLKLVDNYVRSTMLIDISFCWMGHMGRKAARITRDSALDGELRSLGL